VDLDLTVGNNRNGILDEGKIVLFEPSLIEVIIDGECERVFREVGGFDDRDPAGIYVGMKHILKMLARLAPQRDGVGVIHTGSSSVESLKSEKDEFCFTQRGGQSTISVIETQGKKAKHIHML
jgi:hypothetical protein